MAKTKQIVDAEHIAKIVEAKIAEAKEANTPKFKFFSVKNLTSGKALIGFALALLAGWQTFNTLEEGRIKRRKDVEMIPDIATKLDLVSRRLDTVVAKDKWVIIRRVDKHDSLLNLEYRTERIK